MTPWFLDALALLFAWPAVDAFRLKAPPREWPPEQGGPSSVGEPQRLKLWRAAYGVGRANNACWLFAILAVAFAVAGSLGHLK